MGYAHYEVYRKGLRVEAGYGVGDVCNNEGCGTKIDRGLDYLCGEYPGGDEYGCGGYFCDTTSPADDVPRLCGKCSRSWKAQQLDEFADALAELLAKVPGIKSADAEDGKPCVLVELANGLEVMVALGT